jgi:hypothetical protein
MISIWTVAGFLALATAFVMAGKILDKLPDLDPKEIMTQTIMFWSGFLLLNLSALRMAINAISTYFR